MAGEVSCFGSGTITPPNLFVLIQEGAGSINLAENQAALEKEFDKQLSEVNGKLGQETKLKGDLQEASWLGVVESPKDALPDKKTVTLVRSGTLFDEAGHKVYNEKTGIPAELENQALQTRKIAIGSSLDSNLGVFVRRNVPFLVVAKQMDNSDADPKEVSYSVVDKTSGKAIEKYEGGNLFRVANYPRSEFKDQPEYEIVVQGLDKVGNVTSIRLPLYVTNTQASFEAGKAE